jgi:hypothetical protein
MGKKLTEQEGIDLSQAIGYARGKGKIHRTNRLKLMKEAVGFHYSETGSEDKVPINMIELALNIYLQRLVAQNPQVAITTFYPKLKEIVNRFELAGNNLIEDIDLGDTLQTVVTDAMYSKGIIKIGLNRSKVEFGGITHDSGQAFADHVSLDDWFEDMTVDDNENAQFEGNYWNLTIDEAMIMFPGTKKEDFQKRVDIASKEEKDHDLTEGGQNSADHCEFKPLVRMIDVFLKKQNRIIQGVYSGDEKAPLGKILKDFEWTGPKNGPYRKLGFGKVQGNTMPSAPAQHWVDLHSLSNKLFRKLGRQAEAEKTITGVRPGGDKDGDTAIKANDGDMVKLEDPRNIAEIHTGGISAQSLAFVMLIKDLFGYYAGNLDTLGGLGPQADTLGQDQLLSASASMRIQKMQGTVTTFTTAVLQDLMWWLWHDPNPKQKDVVKTAPGYESISITVPFNPDDREGDYLQYNIILEPYSMQHHSPETKMQGIRTFVAEFVMPLFPMMQQQGVTLDIEKLFKTTAKLSNIPELGDIIQFATAGLDQPVGSSDQVKQAPATTRTHIRKSVASPQDDGKKQMFQQALLSNQNKASA